MTWLDSSQHWNWLDLTWTWAMHDSSLMERLESVVLTRVVRGDSSLYSRLESLFRFTRLVIRPKKRPIYRYTSPDIIIRIASCMVTNAMHQDRYTGTGFLHTRCTACSENMEYEQCCLCVYCAPYIYTCFHWSIAACIQDVNKERIDAGSQSCSILRSSPTPTRSVLFINAYTDW